MSCCLIERGLTCSHLTMIRYSHPVAYLLIYTITDNLLGVSIKTFPRSQYAFHRLINMTNGMINPSTPFPVPQLRLEAVLSSDGIDSLPVVEELSDTSVDDGALDLASDDSKVEATTEVPFEPSVIKWPALVTADPPMERVWPCSTATPDFAGTGVAV